MVIQLEYVIRLVQVMESSTYHVSDSSRQVLKYNLDTPLGAGKFLFANNLWQGVTIYEQPKKLEIKIYRMG